MILTRTPLRISFVGGGSDLPSHYEEHGGAVCSITINKYIYITAKPNVSLFPHKYRLVYSQVEEVNEIQDIQHNIIRTVLEYHGPRSLDLDVMSDVPAGTGLGSSSAFTVGLIKAILGNSLYENMDKQTIAEEACRTEIGRLKEPIGKQDQYAASFGGCNLFQFDTDNGVEINRIYLNHWNSNMLRQHLTLAYLGKNRSASALLKEQANNTEALLNMTHLAYTCKSALESQNYQLFGEVIKDGWELKKSLSSSITNDLVDTIISTAITSGASAGKLLGAGGTGFVLLVCPPDKRYAMLSALKPLNLNYVPFEFDFEGSKVLYADDN